MSAFTGLVKSTIVECSLPRLHRFFHRVTRDQGKLCFRKDFRRFQLPCEKLWRVPPTAQSGPLRPARSKGHSHKGILLPFCLYICLELSYLSLVICTYVSWQDLREKIFFTTNLSWFCKICHFQCMARGRPVCKDLPQWHPGKKLTFVFFSLAAKMSCTGPEDHVFKRS